MGQVKVIAPGMYTTVQDRGRYLYQQYGMPVAGAMDLAAYEMANILSGGGANEAVLEITAQGPALLFIDSCIVGIGGANVVPLIDGHEAPMGQSLVINRGSTLSFAGFASGMRSYMSFSQGLLIEEMMGSKSTYVKAGVGGIMGRPLKAGDILDFKDHKDSDLVIRYIHEAYRPVYNHKIDIRVVLGPQDDYFTKEAIHTFLNTPYTISGECDRMGYRLAGEKLAHENGSDIISDGIMMGSVQVPGSGLPIILMADRQTAGGYPKIATVISTDLGLLAQAKPGDQLMFQSVSVEESQNIYRENRKKMDIVRQSVLKEYQNVKNAKSYHMTVADKFYNVQIAEIDDPN